MIFLFVFVLILLSSVRYLHAILLIIVVISSKSLDEQSTIDLP